MNKILVLVAVLAIGFSTQLSASTNLTETAVIVDDYDPAQRVIDKLNEFITLTPQQESSIQSLAAAIDFGAAQTKDERKTLRKQLKDEIAETVLTNDQKRQIRTARG